MKRKFCTIECLKFSCLGYVNPCTSVPPLTESTRLLHRLKIKLPTYEALIKSENAGRRRLFPVVVVRV